MNDTDKELLNGHTLSINIWTELLIEELAKHNLGGVAFVNYKPMMDVLMNLRISCWAIRDIINRNELPDEILKAYVESTEKARKGGNHENRNWSKD